MGDRRLWKWRGHCPNQHVITDSYGRIEFDESAPTQTARECSWLLRPAIYREGGFFHTLAGPITLTFDQLTLKAGETIEIWVTVHACGHACT